MCLDIGITPNLFWDLTIGEVLDLIESYNRKKELESKQYEAEMKQKILLNSVLARQIGEHVGALFSKNAKLTPLTVLFPELFKEEKIESGIQSYKARMLDFAYRHNSRKGEAK